MNLNATPGRTFVTYSQWGTALLLFALAAVPRPGHTATYAVSPGGSDASAGSAAAPWQTLQKAAESVAPGDVVVVEDGDYAGFACRRSGTAERRIVFKARNRYGAKITRANPGKGVDWISILSASYITIDGFDVSGATRAGIGVRSLSDETGTDTRDDIVQNCHSHHNGLPRGGAHDGVFTGFALNFTVQDCQLDHNGEHGIYISNSADNPVARRNHSHHNVASGIQLNADKKTGITGAQDGLISNWLVEGNIIHDNGASGGAAINLDGDINGICRNNLIYNNLASGIALYGIDGARASSDNLIVNNTVYNPDSRRAALLLMNGASGNTVFNNILYSGRGAGIEAEGEFKHDYNLVSRIEGATMAGHEAAPAAVTVFTDLAQLDFHPAANSPALNQGVATFNGLAAPRTDLASGARPAGVGFDIGAYESATAQGG